jgi:hypothetical protein
MNSKEKSNTYVIIPPEQGSAFFVVKDKKLFDNENSLRTEYLDTFEIIFLNQEGVLSFLEHKRFLDRILPSLAMVLQTNYKQETEGLVDAYLDSPGNQEQFEKEFGRFDYTTGLIGIIIKQLDDYLTDVRSVGLEPARLKNNGVLTYLQMGYMELPYFLISSILDSFAKLAKKKAGKKNQNCNISKKK